MCGITGGFFPITVTQAMDAMIHRGRDGSGVWTDGYVTFGHRRLAIQDLDHRSDQPMTRGMITICFGGELWNTVKLREVLQQLGKTFTTTSDTEVIAWAIDEWGFDALEKFDGQFAIAWHEAGSHTICLARDRFGEIPLHVIIPDGMYGGDVAFASERRAFAAMGIHGKIEDVTPGTWAVYNRSGKITEGTYYDAPIQTQEIARDTAALELKRLLTDACQRRLIGDVPTCVLLSGGIDSATIAALASLSSTGVTTAYTAVLNEKSQDLKRARITAEMLMLKLVEVRITVPTDNDLASIVDVIEMPYQAQVEIAWACLALAKQIAADGYKIVLSGEGADELFASYAFAYHGLKTAAWGQYRKDLILEQGHKNFARCNKVFMRYGVECRLPFIDRDVVEFGLSLPKVLVKGASGKEEKQILRDAMRGVVPDAVCDAKKLAFQIGLGLVDKLKGRERRVLYARSYDRQERGARREVDI